jgi:hypothetical protein
MDLFGADTHLGFGDELNGSIYKNLGGSKYLFDHSSESDVLLPHFFKKVV